jgi:uncharacterized protein YukE
MGQYNFKVDDELEAKVKKALEDSGHEGKTDFLSDMVAVYSSHLVNREESMSEKIAAYSHINDSTKEGLEKLFTHLLSTMDYNFSMVSQEQQRIEKERAEVEERAIEVDSHIDKLQLAFIEEKRLLEVGYKDELELSQKESERYKEALEQERKELVKAKEELASLATIAEQTSSVIEENKELRTLLTSNDKEYKEELDQLSNNFINEKNELTKNISELEKLLRAEEQKHFIATHELKRCKEEFSLAKSSSKEDIEKMKQDELALQEKVNGLSEELSGLSSKYNQLLGKVEVFESLSETKTTKK